MPMPEYIRKLRQKVGNDLLMMPTADAIILPDKLPTNIVSFVPERIKHATKLEQPFFRVSE